MRLFVLGILLLGTLQGTSALGRLVQPDGSVELLGEGAQANGRVFLFSSPAVPVASWIRMPPGAVVVEAEVFTQTGRQTLAFPHVSIPGLRYALEVPPGLRSLRIRGQMPELVDLIRSEEPPAQGPQPWVVGGHDTLRIDLPSWKTAQGWTSALEMTRPKGAPWQVVFNGGFGRRTFRMPATVQRWAFFPSAWGGPATQMIVQGSDPRLSEIRVRTVRDSEPLPTDPHTLVAWPTDAWRVPTREWFHWEGTSVLVLVTADYRVQDAYLKRLAFYVEKTGFRGHLVSEEEISNQHGWNAHDYAAWDLARFYTQASREGFRLNAAETELREQLVSAKILIPEGANAWKAGNGALVGISAESPPALRAALFVHEGFHGLYFTSTQFRAGVKTTWDGLSEGAKASFRTFLARSMYDPADEALMINEFQAYVLQRPEVEWKAFFKTKVLAKTPNSSSVSSRLAEYLAAAKKLDTLVRTLYGLSSGTVSPLTVF